MLSLCDAHGNSIATVCKLSDAEGGAGRVNRVMIRAEGHQGQNRGQAKNNRLARLSQCVVQGALFPVGASPTRQLSLQSVELRAELAMVPTVRRIPPAGLVDELEGVPGEEGTLHTIRRKACFTRIPQAVSTRASSGRLPGGRRHGCLYW